MVTNAAARCALRLQSGFQSLRCILMVGIGGGVPTRHDIRLGDVVVSMPGKNHRGVVQYDYGTKFQDENLEIRDSQVNRPPDLLLTAVMTLTANESRETINHELGQRLANYATRLAEQHSSLRKSQRPKVDRLFMAEYRHRDDNMDCDECECDLSKPIAPRVHFGLIASGNEVMRDALERDRLANEMDVLCFEMEAAGLMGDIGCLTIRGICDYCDSHKNKDWQEFAAAVAAAYGRELLKVVPGLKPLDDTQKPTTTSASSTGVFYQQNASGGQFSNISGNVTTYGGKTTIGGNYQSQGPMYF